jgi:hypothetical protein
LLRLRGKIELAGQKDPLGQITFLVGRGGEVEKGAGRCEEEKGSERRVRTRSGGNDTGW